MVHRVHHPLEQLYTHTYMTNRKTSISSLLVHIWKKKKKGDRTINIVIIITHTRKYIYNTHLDIDNVHTYDIIRTIMSTTHFPCKISYMYATGADFLLFFLRLSTSPEFPCVFFFFLLILVSLRKKISALDVAGDDPNSMWQSIVTLCRLFFWPFH